MKDKVTPSTGVVCPSQIPIRLFLQQAVPLHQRNRLRIPGDHRLLAIPVPIPNTVVKQKLPMILLKRESRLSPGFFLKPLGTPRGLFSFSASQRSRCKDGTPPSLGSLRGTGDVPDATRQGRQRGARLSSGPNLESEPGACRSGLRSAGPGLRMEPRANNRPGNRRLPSHTYVAQ